MNEGIIGIYHINLEFFFLYSDRHGPGKHITYWDREVSHRILESISMVTVVDAKTEMVSEEVSNSLGHVDICKAYLLWIGE